MLFEIHRDVQHATHTQFSPRERVEHHVLFNPQRSIVGSNITAIPPKNGALDKGVQTALDKPQVEIGLLRAPMIRGVEPNADQVFFGGAICCGRACGAREKSGPMPPPLL